MELPLSVYVPNLRKRQKKLTTTVSEDNSKLNGLQLIFVFFRESRERKEKERKTLLPTYHSYDVKFLYDRYVPDPL